MALTPHNSRGKQDPIPPNTPSNNDPFAELRPGVPRDAVGLPFPSTPGGSDALSALSKSMTDLLRDINGQVPEHIETDVHKAIHQIVNFLDLTKAERAKILNNLPTVMKAEHDAFLLDRQSTTSYYNKVDNVIAIHTSQRDLITYYHEAAHFVREQLMPLEQDRKLDLEYREAERALKIISLFPIFFSKETKDAAHERLNNALTQRDNTIRDAHEFFAALMVGLLDKMPEVRAPGFHNSPVQASPISNASDSSSALNDHTTEIDRMAHNQGLNDYHLRHTFPDAIKDVVSSLEIECLILKKALEDPERDWKIWCESLVAEGNKIRDLVSLFSAASSNPDIAKLLSLFEDARTMLGSRDNAALLPTSPREELTAIAQAVQNCSYHYINESKNRLKLASRLTKSFEDHKVGYISAAANSKLLEPENRKRLTRLFRTPSYAIVKELMKDDELMRTKILLNRLCYTEGLVGIESEPLPRKP